MHFRNKKAFATVPPELPGVNPRMSSILRLDRLRQFIGELATLLDSRPDESTLLTQAPPAGRAGAPGRLAAGRLRPPRSTALPTVPAACRLTAALLGGQLRLGAGPDHTGTRSSGLGPDRHAPRGRILAAVRLRCGGGRPHPSGARRRLEPGEVEALSPRIGDVHQVSNAFSDRTSISIHVYGANIGAVRRAVFSAEGEEKPFISGYSNSRLPNIWDLSKENPA